MSLFGNILTEFVQMTKKTQAIKNTYRNMQKAAQEL